MAIHLRLLAGAITVTILATIAFASIRQDSISTRKAYVRTGQEGVLTGTITLAGIRPKRSVIDMSADPACYKTNPHPETEWVEGRMGQLANVLVYATSEALDSYAFEQPDSPVVLLQKGCRFEPHVLGLRVGQALSVENLDETLNNVHPTPKYNPEWNQTQAIGAPPIVKTFMRPEISIQLKDNLHPWKKAYVSVFTHPFFAVTDEDGNYSIQGLPPGSYKITAWHERLGEKKVDLVIVPGESRFLTFDFSAPNSKREKY
jgi:hypothetical protein